ncbi:uncharacterized protein ISCGN_027859 [Ixodes scapularis]
MDSPTSWTVAAGCCWINFFYFAIFRSAAIVYVSILTSLDTSRAEAAWPITVMSVVCCVAGPVVGWLASRIAVWKLTVSACLVGSLAVSACFLANGIWFLIVSIGIVHGVSMAFTMLCNTVIRAHFTRNRALACGINYAGQTLSGLVFPPLVQFFLEKYGQKGMFLVTGALMLNSTAGALLHLLPPETPGKPASIFDDGKKLEMPLDITCSDKIGLRDCTADPTGCALSAEDKGLLTQDDGSDKSETVQGVRDHLSLQQAMLSESQNMEDPQNKKQKECYNKKCVSSYNRHDDVRDVHDETATYSVKTFSNRSKITSPSYLRRPQFYIVALTCSVIVFNMSTYSAVIVDFATDRKISKWNAVLLITIYAISDLVSRMGSGSITDKGFLKKSSMMAGNLLLWAISLCAMPFCYSFYLHAIQAVIFGLCSGATFILMPVLLMELVNANKFNECLGFATLIAGIPLLPRPLLIGYFRDSLGDYQGLFVLMGVVTALSAFSCLFLRENHGERTNLFYEKIRAYCDGKSVTSVTKTST